MTGRDRVTLKRHTPVTTAAPIAWWPHTAALRGPAIGAVVTGFDPQSPGHRCVGVSECMMIHMWLKNGSHRFFCFLEIFTNVYFGMQSYLAAIHSDGG